MKKFLKDHGIWVLFAAAVISVALAAMSFFSNTSSPLANLAGTLASPFRSAYTSVASWFNEKQDRKKCAIHCVMINKAQESGLSLITYN